MLPDRPGRAPLPGLTHAGGSPAAGSSRGEMQLAPLPFYRKLCYAIGGAPYQMTGNALGFFLQIFLLDVVQLEPFHSSLILFLGRAWDAVTDPAVGFLISKSPRRRLGKLIPWIVSSTPFGVVFYCLVWSTPSDTMPVSLKFLWYLTMYCFFQTSMSCYHVPYSSLTMFLGGNQRDRDSATAYTQGVRDRLRGPGLTLLHGLPDSLPRSEGAAWLGHFSGSSCDGWEVPCGHGSGGWVQVLRGRELGICWLGGLSGETVPGLWVGRTQVEGHGACFSLKIFTSLQCCGSWWLVAFQPPPPSSCISSEEAASLGWEGRRKNETAVWQGRSEPWSGWEAGPNMAKASSVTRQLGLVFAALGLNVYSNHHHPRGAGLGVTLLQFPSHPFRAPQSLGKDPAALLSQPANNPGTSALCLAARWLPLHVPGLPDRSGDLCLFLHARCWAGWQVPAFGAHHAGCGFPLHSLLAVVPGAFWEKNSCVRGPIINYPCPHRYHPSETQLPALRLHGDISGMQHGCPLLVTLFCRLQSQ
ncbi:uncharacterized protein LOC115634983 isoform X2 [Gopherus evgoodei]|uniref:uncharacterized protein LOC115634983 isoform X2 n=1 Tax=Gopherus evgoodei TaxID=1825980 RepID=UPI0011CFD8D9|nr:uncharacterized protein LOC115634983 isoform X2 [Gopherus evgoodei]